MSGYSFEEAKNLIKNASNLKEMIDIAGKTSAVLDSYPSKYTSILYSGKIGETQAFEVAEKLWLSTRNTLDPLVRVDDTPIGQLLVDRDFRKALSDNILKDLQANHQGFADLSPSEQATLHQENFNRLYNNNDLSGKQRLPYDPQNLSFWDSASQRFVKEVLTITQN